MKAPDANPKSAMSAALPLVQRLLSSGADGAKISMKSKIGVKIGGRKKKLRSAFGQGGM